ncbi:MAG: hypothetical protein HC836_38160 [Richelia sp. RM2_1_2]|nr:hypothetical protein [Richelia sp. RM2_1_2]
MTNVYFDSGGYFATSSFSTGDSTLIKNALVLVEGIHKDNKGRTHEFPASRIQKLVDNTNASLSTGTEIPLMIDHSKELLSGGELKKLGELDSTLECRIIQRDDLPNSKMHHLIGKLGAFGKFAVRSRIEDVKSGLIKLLSPGIDLENERVAEVSAVAFPAIHGPALFKKESTAFFSVSYDEVKEQYGTQQKLRKQAAECLDILFKVMSDIESLPEQETVGINLNSLKTKQLKIFYRI